MPKRIVTLVAVIAMAVLVSASYAVYAIDEAERAKQGLKDRQTALQEQIRSETDPRKIEQMSQGADTLKKFQELLVLSEKLEQAYEDGDEQKIAEYQALADKINEDLKTRAGDRIVNGTVIHHNDTDPRLGS